MSDARPLPARPNLEHYKKLAKETLHTEAGSGLWARFKKPDPCKLTDAQFALARAHGFKSWPAFSKHLEGLERANSPVSQYEAAADAIVDGDVPKLRELLQANPELIHARSTRDHRSTLLHYVSANGVEGFRQKTSPQIVEITRLLLDAGADVNAESDAYAGHSTTIMLTATSGHPEDAGLQIPLMQLLVERGARFDGGTVTACLHNGRGQAAEWLAAQGVPLDLEGAAGVGQLDVVAQLLDRASAAEIANGLAWACEYGRLEVARFLLQKGVSPARQDGQPTPLHWASYSGRADLVKLLFEYGAPIDAVENRFSGTPIGWAMYAWAEPHSKRDGHYEVVALLVRAGAELDPKWQTDEKIVADPRMRAALRGE